MDPDSGWDQLEAERTDTELRIGGNKVMKRWETPLMRRMAERLCTAADNGRIVEVGFGMGISASCIQEQGVASHTIVEPHPECLNTLKAWRSTYSERRIEIVDDYWQNVLHLFDECDAVFFDTYATSRQSLIEENSKFLLAASRRLRPGASVALFWILPTLDDTQQRYLFQNYSRVEIEPVAVAPGETGVIPLKELGFLLSILATK